MNDDISNYNSLTDEYDKDLVFYSVGDLIDKVNKSVNAFYDFEEQTIMIGNVRTHFGSN